MITIPLNDIKAKIKEQTSVSDEELNAKIKAKLDQLSGLISEEGAAHIIANELGVKLVAAQGEKLTVKNILAGMRNIEVNGKVTRKFELREFEKGDRKGKLASLMISDETGMIRVVFWNDQTDKFNEIKEGDIIKVENGYVRDNNNRKEIHLNDQAKVTLNPEGVKINAVRDSVQRKKLKELAEGDENIEVLATIVQVFDIRFFEIDPETGKRAIAKDGKFYFGEKEVPNPGYNYVLNLFLDDGSDNVRTVLWKNQIINLLKKTDEEILQYKDNPAAFETVKNELLGEIVKIIGRTNMNKAFERLELVANVIYRDVNPDEEINKLQSANNIVPPAVPTAEPIPSTPVVEEAIAPAAPEPTPTPAPEPVVNTSEPAPVENVEVQPVQTQASTETVEVKKAESVENMESVEEEISIDDLEDLSS